MFLTILVTLQKCMLGVDIEQPSLILEMYEARTPVFFFYIGVCVVKSSSDAS